MHKLGYIVKWHLVSAKPYNMLNAYPNARVLLHAQEHTNTRTHTRPQLPGKLFWCLMRTKTETSGNCR